jgi:hypothetical protein
MNIARAAFVAVALLTSMSAAAAQIAIEGPTGATTLSSNDQENTTESPAQSAPATSNLPLGAWVQLEIVNALSSETATAGQQIALRLAEPVIVNGQEVLPAGILGVGEVIDAKPNGTVGRPGILTVGSRYLDFNDQQIGLEGMLIGGSGRNNANVARVGAALLGPAMAFIRGGEVEVPAGARVEVRLAGGAPEVSPALAGINPVPAPAPDTGTVVFFGNDNNFHTFGVAENGVVLARLQHNSYQSVSLQPGPHAFVFTWGSGRPVEESMLHIELREGEILFVNLTSSIFLAPSTQEAFGQRQWRPADPLD